MPAQNSTAAAQPATRRADFLKLPFRYFPLLLKTQLAVLTPLFLTLVLLGGQLLVSSAAEPLANEDPFATEDTAFAEEAESMTSEADFFDSAAASEDFSFSSEGYPEDEAMETYTDEDGVTWYGSSGDADTDGFGEMGEGSFGEYDTEGFEYDESGSAYGEASFGDSGGTEYEMSGGGGGGFFGSILSMLGSSVRLVATVLMLLVLFAFQGILTGSFLYVTSSAAAATPAVRDVRTRIKQTFSSKLRMSLLYTLYLLLIFVGVIASLGGMYFLTEGRWQAVVETPFVILLLPLVLLLFLLGVFLLLTYAIKMVDSDTTKAARRQASILLAGKWGATIGWTGLLVLVFLLNVALGLGAAYFTLQAFAIDPLSLVMGGPLFVEYSSLALLGIGALATFVLLSFCLLGVIFFWLGMGLHYYYLARVNGDAQSYFDSRFELVEAQNEVRIYYQKGRTTILRTVLLLLYPSAAAVALLLNSQGQIVSFIPIAALVLYLLVRVLLRVGVSAAAYDRFMRVEITLLTLPIVLGFFVSLFMVIRGALSGAETLALWALGLGAAIIALLVVYFMLRLSYFTLEASPTGLFYWRGPWKPLLILFGFKRLDAQQIAKVYARKEPYVGQRQMQEPLQLFFADQEYEHMKEMTAEDNAPTIEVFRNTLYIATPQKEYRLMHFREDSYVEAVIRAIVARLHLQSTYIQGELISAPPTPAPVS